LAKKENKANKTIKVPREIGRKIKLRSGIDISILRRRRRYVCNIQLKIENGYFD